MPTSAKLVRTAGDVPVVVHDGASGTDRERATSCIGDGADIIDVAVVGRRLWLPSIMEALVARGVTRLLVEGGPRIWRAFADAALVDEVILYMAGAPSDEEALKAVVPVNLGRAVRSSTGEQWALIRCGGCSAPRQRKDARRCLPD